MNEPFNNCMDNLESLIKMWSEIGEILSGKPVATKPENDNNIPHPTNNSINN